MASFKKMILNNSEIDVDDPNDVETDGGELADTVINYDSATTPTIGSFTQFLDRFTSGTKVGAWFKNFRAGCDFLLHIGSLVNNCVSDNETLPLAAAQGKVLMDLITQANETIDANKTDLQDQITQINSDLLDLKNDITSYLTTAIVNTTLSLSTGTSSFSVDPNPPDGYTTIGIVGYNGGASSVFMTRLSLTNARELYITLINSSSSTVNITFYFYVLYAKW